jgi:hypothetical protein
MPEGPARMIKPSTWNKLIHQIATGIVMATLASVKGGTFEVGLGGTVLIVANGGTVNAAGQTWPHKVYDKTTGSTGQVQINGGDGSVASVQGPLNVAILNVNGTPNNQKTGGPPDYPKLAIPDNGYVYSKAVLTNAGGITTYDVFFTTDISDISTDTATPPLFCCKLLATISNYAVDGTGDVSFTVEDANGPIGFNTINICGNTVTMF